MKFSIPTTTAVFLQILMVTLLSSPFVSPVSALESEIKATNEVQGTTTSLSSPAEPQNDKQPASIGLRGTQARQDEEEEEYPELPASKAFPQTWDEYYLSKESDDDISEGLVPTITAENEQEEKEVIYTPEESDEELDDNTMVHEFDFYESLPVDYEVIDDAADNIDEEEADDFFMPSYNYYNETANMDIMQQEEEEEDQSLLLESSFSPQSVWRTMSTSQGKEKRTGWFSEELQWGNSYYTGGLIAGIRCSGRYCDNKKLYTRHRGMRSPIRTTGLSVTRWFSEETRGRTMCPGNKVVREMHCGGDYCDNIRFTCVDLAPGYRVLKNNIRTTTVSEEQGLRWCSNGHYLVGGECSGRYCDNFKMICALVQYDANVDRQRVSRPSDISLVRKFAPVMVFDQKASQFPLRRSMYVNEGSWSRVARSDYSWHVGFNRNYMGLSYQVNHCSSTGVTRIHYVSNYVGQQPCTLGFGGHKYDTERVIVELSVDLTSIIKVSYFQHGGLFTRMMGTFPFERRDGGLHMKSYVGKNSNGQYNDDGGTGGCFYWEDYRNVGRSGKILRSWREGSLEPYSPRLRGERSLNNVCSGKCWSSGCSRNNSDLS